MYLYSNLSGTYVLSQNFEVREKVLYSKDQLIEISALLEEEKTLAAEEDFINKFKNIENLRKTKDLKKIRKAIEAIGTLKFDFCFANTYIVKNKIAKSVTEDILIVQCVNAIDEYAKSSNLLCKRLREWYSYYFPEASEKVSDNEDFVKMILSKPKNILAKEFAITQSMGGTLSNNDVSAIIALANAVSKLYESKKTQEIYLEEIMQKVAPNLSAVAGAAIGAKLISLAGSMKKLVLFPSSTIQLLGAEKALFRHLINRKVLPPKHGILHEHKLLLNSPRKNHGKVARSIADKVSLAVKIDYFHGEYRGDLLKKELEDKVRAINAS